MSDLADRLREKSDAQKKAPDAHRRQLELRWAAEKAATRIEDLEAENAALRERAGEDTSELGHEWTNAPCSKCGKYRGDHGGTHIPALRMGDQIWFGECCPAFGSIAIIAAES